MTLSVGTHRRSEFVTYPVTFSTSCKLLYYMFSDIRSSTMGELVASHPCDQLRSS